ncbi:hypothetical protein GE061_003953 [Apolygus lucorum]|uniref:Uncharacterized protein n=1 Tax=Apolygus lucorum TaxID=248454 RepID=A0A6A4IWP4_APOLU|nr:hypothetical protein GE061_003953 [Apolygus lucorum]
MKFVCFVVLAVSLTTASAGFLRSLSDTHNALRNAALNAASAQLNMAKTIAKAHIDVAKNITAMNLDFAKTVANAQVTMAKATVSTASEIAQRSINTAKNVTANIIQEVSTRAINTGVGILIAQMRTLIKSTGKNNITIPDLNTKTGPVTVNATRGFFTDISSISQAGKANVTVNGTSLVIDLPLKLDQIETGYKKFLVSMWKMQGSGGLNVHIANDTFVVHLRLTPGFNCALNVEKVDVAVFGGITLDFTDMGKKSEYLIDKCSNMIVKFMKENIKKQVQTAIDTNIKKVLKENGSICSKFLG